MYPGYPMTITEKARAARGAGQKILSLTGDSRTSALEAVRRALDKHRDSIIQANGADLDRSIAEGLAAPLMKRLKFDGSKMDRVLEGIEALEREPDPIGTVLLRRELDEGLILEKIAGPIGLIGMIFESRPDALIQMATLCLRSGNAVILKGGSEARETNRALTEVITEASIAAGAPAGWIQLAESREDVREMLGLDGIIDLLIPRGSKAFVSRIMRDSAIPVLGHADGICHVFLDTDADEEKAVKISVDSKMQYVAVCNAAETLLVHADAAQRLLPPVTAALREAGCALKGCERTRKIVNVEPATEEDWSTEYLDAVLSIKVVDSLDEAIAHIHTYGSGHTEAIVTENTQTADAFLARVDAADVFANCSTRFSDGFRYGLGAEVGISTAKIHARGPVGVEGLLIYRWIVRGKGHIVADYAKGRRRFTHREL